MTLVGHQINLSLSPFSSQSQYTHQSGRPPPPGRLPESARQGKARPPPSLHSCVAALVRQCTHVPTVCSVLWLRILPTGWKAPLGWGLYLGPPAFPGLTTVGP